MAHLLRQHVSPGRSTTTRQSTVGERERERLRHHLREKHLGMTCICLLYTFDRARCFSLKPQPTRYGVYGGVASGYGFP